MMRKKIKIIIFGVTMAALHLTACSPATVTDAPVSPGRYTITGVAVVDVEKGIILPDQTVILEDSLIQAVGPQSELSAPQGARVIDGRGLYVMPGLVDAHVHYFDAAVFGRLMLANGVLLVRDTGMPNEYILKLRDGLNRGETLGPEMIATGVMLDGYPPLIPSIALGIQTPEEGRTAVRQQAEAGADMIKTYSRLDKEVFLAILDEAKKHHLKVVTHLPESVYLEDAAAAGLGSSEHFNGFEKVIAKLLGEPVRLYFAGQAADSDYFARLGEVDPQELRALYQRMHASGLTICPTVVTFKTLTHIKAIQTGSFPYAEYISPGVSELWKSLWAQQGDIPEFIWQNWAQMVRELNQAGVPLMVGTDLMLPGIIPGYSVHEEMAIWQEAGIPPADVLRSATLVPVRFMGLEDRLGTVTAGKTASLVLVKANPLEDIRNAQLVEAVFLRGQYYGRDDLKQLLSEARELARP